MTECRVEVHGPKGTATVWLPCGHRARLRFGDEWEATRRCQCGHTWTVEVTYDDEADTVTAYAGRE